jgi:hypothetical protein
MENGMRTASACAARRAALAARVILAAVWLPAGFAAAQEPVHSVETWAGQGTAGWSNGSPQAALANAGGWLELKHGKQDAPASAADTARGLVPPHVMPTNMSFRFLAVHDAPSALRLCFHSAREDHTWYVSLPPPRAGRETAFDVPVNRSAGWSMGPVSRDDQFQSDLRSVDWVGVYVRRHGDVAAQAYRVDDFALSGLRYTDDDDMDGMADWWEDRHGLDRGDWRDARTDKDRDEFRAGTLPEDADSSFRVDIAVTNRGPTAAGVVLRWPSIPDRTYGVWRADGLGSGFTRLRAGLPATPSTNEYVDAGSTNGRCFFYRVQVE